MYENNYKNKLKYISIIKALKFHSFLWNYDFLFSFKAKFDHYIIFPCFWYILSVFLFILLIVFNEIILRSNSSVLHIPLNFHSLTPYCFIIFTGFPNKLLELLSTVLGLEDWFSWDEIFVWVWLELFKEDYFGIILDATNWTEIFVYFYWNLVGELVTDSLDFLWWYWCASLEQFPISFFSNYMEDYLSYEADWKEW